MNERARRVLIPTREILELGFNIVQGLHAKAPRGVVDSEPPRRFRDFSGDTEGKWRRRVGALLQVELPMLSVWRGKSDCARDVRVGCDEGDGCRIRPMQASGLALLATINACVVTNGPRRFLARIMHQT